MSKNNYTFKNFGIDSFWNIITKFFIILLKSGSSIITARFLGPYERGIYYSIILFTGLINSIFTISVGDGIIFNISKYKKNFFIFGNLIFFVLFFSFINFLILFFLETFIRNYFLKDIPDLYYNTIYFLIPLFIIEYIASFSLRGLKLFTISNKISIFSKIISISILIFSFLLFGISVEIAFYSIIVSYTIISLTYCFFIYRLCFFNFIFDIKRKLEILIYSLKIHLNNFLNEAEYRFDIPIILFFLDYKAVGIYSIGVAVSQIVLYVSNSINTVLFPFLLSSHSQKNKLKYTDRVIKINFIINIYIIIFLIIFGNFLIPFVYGKEYLESFYVFLFLSPAILFDSISRNIFVYLKSEKNPILLSKISFVTLLLNILLNIFLIPNYGIYGAAIASLISYLLRSIITIYIFNNSRVNKFRIYDIFNEFTDITFDLIKKIKKIFINK